jgi:hypothetical protein
VIQVRKHRKADHPQRFIATGGRLPPDEVLSDVGGHHNAPGAYVDEGTFVRLAARGQIVLRYAEDVNGALGNVAGVVNEAGNILGVMPHPEHAVDPLLGSADGGLLLAALVDAAARRLHALTHA